MARRIPNPIYRYQKNLTRFKLASTWSQKISIMCDLAQPKFSQEQIEFLLSEDPAHWAAQDEILNQHGCGLTILQQGIDLDSETQTVYDLDQDFLGEYILPRLTIDLLIQVVSLNELNRPGTTILDMGAGTGQLFKELRDHSVTSDIHGADSPNKESYYVLTHTYDKFVQADLRYALPIQDNTYDVIVCSNVFMQSVMEMENDPPLTADSLDEILRILVPGGIFIFNVDRFVWAAIDQKLNQLTNINILKQTWVYQRDRLYMFPPTRLCIAVQKH